MLYTRVCFVLLEQFRVCTGYWILKNNGATSGRNEKWDISVGVTCQRLGTDPSRRACTATPIDAL